jgi:hypothetical protein
MFQLQDEDVLVHGLMYDLMKGQLAKRHALEKRMLSLQRMSHRLINANKSMTEPSILAKLSSVIEEHNKSVFEVFTQVAPESTTRVPVQVLSLIFEYGAPSCFVR